MPRLTLTRKILAGYALTLLAAAVAAGALYSTLASVRDSLRVVTVVEVPQSAAAYEMEINVIGAGLGVLGYLDTGDPRQLARVREDRAEFEGYLDRYRRLAEDSVERRLAQQMEALHSEFVEVGDRLIASRTDRDARPARASNTRRFNVLRNELDDTLDEGVQAREARELAAAQRQAGSAATAGLDRLLAVLVIAALLIVAVAVVVTRHLVGRIARLTEGTDAVTGGDLSHRIESDGDDELARLTDNFNRMVGELEATTVSKAARVDSDDMLPKSVLALEREIGERRGAQIELSHEKERAQVTLDSIADGVVRVDDECTVAYLNPVASDLLGWSDDEARGKPLDDVLRTVEEATGDSASDLVSACGRDGQPRSSNHTVLSVGREGHTGFAAEISVAPVRDPHDPERSIVGVVLAFRDISRQREMAEQLSFNARHDGLTRLYNRAEFERRVEQSLQESHEEGHHHVVCYIDFDQFKVVNDTCGHIAGDKLLNDLATLFRAEVRDTDMLARLGGDEFGVLLQHCPADEGLAVAEKLRRVVGDYRFEYGERSFAVATSIGVVPLAPESGSLADVLSAADAACYAAKDAGRNRIQLYHNEDVGLARRQGEMRWVTRINQALAEDRFELHFQRIAPIGEGEGLEVGEQHEVLVRMVDEEGELVSPGTFIPAAERYGLMAAVDRWVIAAAFELVASRRRQDPGGPLERYAINLSGASLGDETCLAFIREKLALHPTPPEAFCFEVTETAAISQLGSAIEFMEDLRALGCQFSLDDFGSGLSSFAYLKSLPVDFVKIDGAFVKDIVDDPADHAMVEAINRVGQVMGIRTIAEFVEDQAILDLLARIGVDYAQGYHIGRPGPAEQTLTPAIATNGHGAPVGAARR